MKWEPGEAAEISRLNGGAGEKRPARILEISGKRVHVAAGESLAAGAAVRLEWEGQLILGQVLNSDAGGAWIEIHHMLLDTSANWPKQGWQRG